MMQELYFHPRHIHASGTFALAAFAAHAQRQCLVHRLRGKCSLSKLTSERQAQRIRTTACEVSLVAGNTIRRTHAACVELAAVPVVVAHLHRAGEAAPLAPVQGSLDADRHVARSEAEQTAVIHLRRPHDLAGIHQALRIEQSFHLAQGACEAFAK